MANYLRSKHVLSYNSDFSVLKVEDDEGVLVASYDLESAHQVKCEGNDYLINSTTFPSGFVREFDAEEGDEVSFNATDHIGISDLRTEKSIQHTYHLDECPIVVKHENGKLRVQSPCVSPCSAPLSVCCTSVEL